MTASAQRAGGLGRLIALLGVALAVQGALAVALWWPEDPAARAARPLLQVDREAIVELEIASGSGSEQSPVRLARGQTGWELASAGGYPAVQERVDGVLELLLSVAVRDPIASQATSYDSLKVGDAEFGRRVRVKTRDGESTLWLGAASRDSAHIRTADGPEVYVARGVEGWRLRDSASSYVDTKLVSADPKSITAFTLRNAAGTLSFVRQTEGWTLEDSEVAIDPGAVDEFLAAVTVVEIAEPVGREAEAAWGLADGPRIDWMEVSDEQSIAGGYAVGQAVADRNYVQAAGSRLIALADGSAFDRLRNATLEEFSLPEPSGEGEVTPD